MTSQATSRVLTVQSGGAGEYAVDALMPGKYKVEVQAANFKTATQDVTLEVGQVLPLNFTLSAGAVTETVEVISEVPMVDNQTSALAEVIQGRQVVDPRLNGRNFTP